MRSRINNKLVVLAEIVDKVKEQSELCRRPGCWHSHFDSDSDDESAEQSGLWARLGCAYDNPWYY